MTTRGRRVAALVTLAAVGALAVGVSVEVSRLIAGRERKAARAQLDDWGAAGARGVRDRFTTDTDRLRTLLSGRQSLDGLTTEQWWDGVTRVGDRGRSGQWRAVMLLRPGAGDTWYKVDVPQGRAAPTRVGVSRIAVWESSPLLSGHVLSPRLAAALASARDSGQPWLSEVIREADSPTASVARAAVPGFALVVPLYDDRLPDAPSDDERREHLTGWLVADVLPDSLLGEPSGPVPADAAARVIDMDGVAVATLGRPHGARRELRAERDLELGGVSLRLEVTRPDPVPLLAPAPLVSLLGITATLLLLSLFRLRAEDRARRLVTVRTADLRERTLELQLVTDRSPDLMLRLGAAGQVLFANPAVRSAMGVRGDPVGRPLVDLGVDDETAARLLEAVTVVHARGAPHTFDLVSTVGEVHREYEVSAVPVPPPVSGGGAEVLVVGRDVTERRLAERALAHRVLHDPLTGLATRALVEERLASALARRDGPLVAVLLLDLDRFKLVNDSLGHSVGDELLQQIAGRLRACTAPEQDALGRLGGDEFVVVTLLDNAAQGQALARSLLAAFEQPFPLRGASFTFTASVGVAVADGAPPVPGELLSRADVAMYRAKAAGGNAVAVYEPTLADAAWGRLMRAEELRVALAHDELHLDYQPEIDLRDEGVGGLEALVRWRHPRLGLLAPGGFVPVAEETGLIVQLGEWVLERAVSDAAAHVREGRPPVRVWVNVSARQLALTDVADAVEKVLVRHEAPGSWLGVEVTESAFLAEDARVELSLQRLRERGVAVAVDDFGTGWSSLSRLQDLPVDVLKVDQAFVRALGGPSGDRAEHIVRAIVAMGRALSATVVAEGIQTPEELDRVRALGCDVGQGFLLARPARWDQAMAGRHGSATDGSPP